MTILFKYQEFPTLSLKKPILFVSTEICLLHQLLLNKLDSAPGGQGHVCLCITIPRAHPISNALMLTEWRTLWKKTSASRERISPFPLSISRTLDCAWHVSCWMSKKYYQLTTDPKVQFSLLIIKIVKSSWAWNVRIYCLAGIALEPAAGLGCCPLPCTDRPPVDTRWPTLLLSCRSPFSILSHFILHCPLSLLPSVFPSIRRYGWIASPTQWTGIWANSEREWRTGIRDWMTTPLSYPEVPGVGRSRLLDHWGRGVSGLKK